MLEAKLVKSLRCPTNKLTRFDQEPFDDPKLFRSTPGALQYLSITRPDISFIVNRVRQFLHNPCTPHWTVVKRILWYLKHTIHFGLLFRQSRSSCLCAYFVADWAGCTSDGRSTVRYCIFLGHNLTLWSSKKQITASHSSTEAKYKVVANTADELICIQSLLTELGVPIVYSQTIYCDNIGATYLTSNMAFRVRTKHIEIDYHFIWDQVATKKLKVRFLSSKDQLADGFTKPIVAYRFDSTVFNLNVRSLPLRFKE